MEKLKNKKGFTLIELIVVIAILGILMLFLVPAFKGYLDDANEAVARSHAKTLEVAFRATNAKLSMTGKSCETMEYYDPKHKDEFIVLLDEQVGDLKDQYGISYNNIGSERNKTFYVVIVLKDKRYTFDLITGTPELMYVLPN